MGKPGKYVCINGCDKKSKHIIQEKDQVPKVSDIVPDVLH